MASNPRKRAPDPTWKRLTIPKVSKLSSADEVPGKSEYRRQRTLEKYSIRQRLRPSSTPSSQRDFNSYSTSALSSSKPVHTNAPRSSGRASSSLSGREPALSTLCPGDTFAPVETIPFTASKPAVLYPLHPASKVGHDGHTIPYPLGLMPYESWKKLHNGGDLQNLPFVCCAVCGGKREALFHTRKLFLVAERLTWEEGIVSVNEKSLNANLNTKLNHELNIQSPITKHEECAPGGKHSKTNKYHPYRNQHEVRLAFKLVFTTDNLTQAAWSLWIGTQLDIEKMLERDETGNTFLSGGTKGRRTGAADTTSHDCASDEAKSPLGLLTPPLSSREEVQHTMIISKTPASTTAPQRVTGPDQPATDSTAQSRCSKRIVSYRSLQDFYSLLDKIERRSYVGALFLEAYAERLRKDMCKDCWFNHNVRLDIYQA